ncbi:MAG TPA: arginine deiminase family protein [Cyclobacteriaceae bacterium]
MSKYTSHSEVGKLKSVFIKGVSEAFVSDTQLQQHWKDLNYLSKPDFSKAVKEFQEFERLLAESGTDLHYFPPNDNVNIDSIYCRDAAMATDYGLIICNMGKKGRASEPQAEKEAFEMYQMKVLGEIKAPGTLEGGDVCWLDEKTLAVGQTYRTNSEGIRQLQDYLTPHGINILTVPLPHYKGPADVFHLMSILSPVDKNLAVVYSPLMPIIFRNELINRGYDLVEVPDEEFESMGCNVLATAPRKCLLVKGNPKTKLALQNVGCEVLVYEGNEISVKGGGGPTCLTRPILRYK